MLSSYYETLDMTGSEGTERSSNQSISWSATTHIGPAMPRSYALTCPSGRRSSMDTYLPILSPDQRLLSNGHARSVLCSYDFVSGYSRCILLKAKVNLSQKGPNHAREAWMIARKDGQIVCISTAESHRQHNLHMADLNPSNCFHEGSCSWV